MSSERIVWNTSKEYRKKIIAEALRHYRIERNLTQKEVAESVGIKLTTYNAYENGASEPNAETIVRLSHVLDITTDELLQRNKIDTNESIDNLRDLLENYEEYEKAAREMNDPIYLETVKNIKAMVNVQIEKLYSEEYKETEIAKLLRKELGLETEEKENGET